MAGLDELSLALRAGAQGKADLAGLDEDYTRAATMRDTPQSQINRYGQVSPLSVMADVLRQSSGRKKLREIAPQRAAARSAMADSASALPLYQAQTAADKFQYAKESDATKATALVQAAQAKATRAAETARTLATAKGGARSKPEAWVNKDGSGQVTGFMTDEGFVDVDGQPVDIANKIPYKEYSVSTKSVGGGVGKTSAKDLAALKSSIRAVDNTFQAIETMTTEDQAAFNDKGHQAKIIAMKAMTPASFEALVESSFAGYPPATQNMLIQLNKMSAVERNRMFGSALTATELSSSKDFLPAVMGRGLPWIVEALKTGKKASVNGLLDSNTGQRGWMEEAGIITPDYQPEARAMTHDPLTPDTPAAPFFADPEKQARYEAYKRQKQGAAP